MLSLNLDSIRASIEGKSKKNKSEVLQSKSKVRGIPLPKNSKRATINKSVVY